MPKLYNQSSSSERVKPAGPRPETITRILSFSKSLTVLRLDHMVVETINN